MRKGRIELIKLDLKVCGHKKNVYWINLSIYISQYANVQMCLGTSNQGIVLNPSVTRSEERFYLLVLNFSFHQNHVQVAIVEKAPFFLLCWCFKIHTNESFLFDWLFNISSFLYPIIYKLCTLVNRGSEENYPCQENRSIGMLLIWSSWFLSFHAKKTTFSFHYVFFLLNMNECVKRYNISAPVISGRIHTFPFQDLASNFFMMQDVAKLFHPLVLERSNGFMARIEFFRTVSPWLTAKRMIWLFVQLILGRKCKSWWLQDFDRSIEGIDVVSSMPHFLEAPFLVPVNLMTKLLLILSSELNTANMVSTNRTIFLRFPSSHIFLFLWIAKNFCDEKLIIAWSLLWTWWNKIIEWKK